jgi:hypothetical protein
MGKPNQYDRRQFLKAAAMAPIALANPGLLAAKKCPAAPGSPVLLGWGMLETSVVSFAGSSDYCIVIPSRAPQ